MLSFYFLEMSAAAFLLVQFTSALNDWLAHCQKITAMLLLKIKNKTYQVHLFSYFHSYTFIKYHLIIWYQFMFSTKTYIFSIGTRLGQNKKTFFTTIIIQLSSFDLYREKNVNRFRFITINQCNIHDQKKPNNVFERNLQI